jgi:amino acid transporter
MSHLRRSLGLPVLLCYGVGVIVGAGIYSIIGAVVGEAGGGAWLSLLVAATLALLVGLCYAELVSMLPRAGASYVYVREAAPRRPWAAFLTGYTYLAAAAVTATTVAAAFGSHLGHFLGTPGWLGALALLGACTLINIAGIKESTWFTVALTAIEVAGLVVIIGLGIDSGRLGERALELSAGTVFTGAALSFFVYTGFEGLANLAEEARKPRRQLPIAILASLAFTTLVYVLVALAIVGLASPEDIAASGAPLVTAAADSPPWLRTALGWVALFSMANTALITLVVTSRTMMAMGEEGQLPRVLGTKSARRQSPWVAALAMGACAAVFLPLGEVAILGSVSSLLVLLVFAAVAAALVALRRRRPDLRGPFRVPLAVKGVPLVPVATIIAVAVLGAGFAARVYAAAAGAVALGLLLYVSRRWWGGGRAPVTASSPADGEGHDAPPAPPAGSTDHRDGDALR